MSLIDAIRYRLKTLVRRRAAEAEREEEFRFHLSLEEMQRRHTGLSPDEARLASKRGFGNPTSYREEVRRLSLGARLDNAHQSIRYAIRSLIRAPGFSVAALVTLGLGIGGVAAIGTLIKAVLLEPLRFPDPSRLVAIYAYYGSVDDRSDEMSDALYFTLKRFARAAEHLGAFYLDEANLSEASDPERVSVARVSAGFFSVLGASPIMGRVFGEAEDRRNGPPVVVLSELVWRRKFRADPAIVGRTVQVDGQPREVLGVLPSSVRYPRENVQFWVPLALDPEHVLPISSNYHIIARLRPNATLAAAELDFQRSIDHLPELYPDAGFGFTTKQLLELQQLHPRLTPLRDEVVGDVGSILWVLAGASAFVLLVACANVATLFLVRAEGRRREVAVRAALGAGRSGLVSQVLAEALVLAGAGAGMGIGLTTLAVALLSRTGAAKLPRLSEVSIGGTVLVGVVVLTALVGLACSGLAIGKLWTLPTASVLRSGGRGTTGGGDRQRARKLLVATQVALAFTLLAGSGLLARTYWKLRSIQPGFAPARVLAFRVGLPTSSYPNAAMVSRLFDGALERLAAIPGARAVGAVSKLPLRPGGGSGNSIFVEGRQLDVARDNGNVVFVMGDYFRAMTIPVLAGRVIDRVDPDRPNSEVVVSANVATRYWADPASAVGRRIRFAPTVDWLTVVGVVGDVRSGTLDQPPPPTVYLPPTSSWVTTRLDPLQARLADLLVPRGMSIVIATTGQPSSLAGPARAAIRSLDPTLPLFDVTPMTAVLSSSLARTTFTGWMLAGAAGIALLLGVVGVYGVVAYTVSLRTREIGLRLALGAEPPAIRAMLAGQGMRLVGAGILGGVALTLALTRSLDALLFGVPRNDPVTLLMVALLLGVAALAATWIPARRAGRVDPVVTLAEE